MDIIMASINEVYGKQFQEKAVLDKALNAAKLLSSNIAHKQFNFRNESPDMWNGNNMKAEVIQTLVNTPSTMNPNLRVIHIRKTSNEIDMFPYLINGPVEYFVVIEMSGEAATRIYSIYITSMKMEAF
jgi:hypothetical protein